MQVIRQKVVLMLYVKWLLDVIRQKVALMLYAEVLLDAGYTTKGCPEATHGTIF